MSLTISRTDLARRTREIVEQARSGQTIIVQSYDGDQVVLLDVTDYLLLRALASYSTRSNPQSDDSQVRFDETLRDYLDARINLGKAAERLSLSRFDLMERFERLGVPLRLGSETPAEARAEVASARKSRR